jgi:hypothetical protein
MLKAQGQYATNDMKFCDWMKEMSIKKCVSNLEIEITWTNFFPKLDKSGKNYIKIRIPTQNLKTTMNSICQQSCPLKTNSNMLRSSM